ncbi:cbb3-type cytochrome c oxidase subunit I [Spirosoma sp. RP8]|uniref:Cbb3-type cytochrome c oxidase subunit I n=1 Tax=Spirosoma liriopis TaxID=2937440 RepID=A0ABT0HUT6_9BACT|nr:cbb3-type cytochrome c oxidase subunit I [Spirosoma liriopis]MCK8495978.1 cbb3-type cytochrome c oxidase subunit I [Spirosoma liriopis]
MKILPNKPYLISWLAIPLLVLVGLLFREHTLNVQFYDTYFVIANLHVALAGSILLLVVGMGYWLIGLSGKTTDPFVARSHLSLTIGGLVIVTSPLFSSDRLAGTEWLFLVLLTLLLAQCAYIVNSVATLLRK